MTDTVNVFQEATRLRLRFDGEAHQNLTTEQLWDLPLTTTRATQSSLDGAGKIVKKALRELGDDGIVSTGNNELRKLLELKLAVLVAIVEYKQAENVAKVQKIAAQSQVVQLESLLETKKAAELQNLPTEEIEKRLAEARAKASV